MCVFETLLHKFSPKKEWLFGTYLPIPRWFCLLALEVLGLKDCVGPSGAGKNAKCVQSESP